jgi:two-component system, cell cycle sensor histidine kinase and response regulator CckA
VASPRDGNRFQRLVEGAQDIIYTCDPLGYFTYVNPMAARVMKYDADELVGRHFLTLIHLDYRLRAEELYRRQIVERKANTYFEFPALAKDGTKVWVGQHVQLIDDGTRVTGFQAIARDITRQKDAEERLHRSEERFMSLVLSARHGIFRSSIIDGRFLDVNPAFVAMLGYDSAATVLSLKVSALYRDVAVRTRILQEIHRSGKLDGLEVEWTRKDGDIATVRLSGQTVADEHGSLTEFVVICEDVTEQRRLEEQLRQMQKIEAVGQLAGGIAHNFNNLLTAMLGYTELLLTRHREGTDREELEEIQKAGQRAGKLTHQLLAFSRKQVPVPREVDVNQTVADLRNMLTGLINQDIALTCALSPTPAVIQIDPSALEQVLLNLVINARDAVPPGGHIGLEVSHAVASDLDDQMPSGDCVRLRVRDNGSGLSDEAREHLFEPFFTTKEPGKGTGLGLASVYGIVRQSHGTISVKSEVGQGTTFTLCWPAIQIARRAPIEPRPASSPETASPTETILLVEDEDTVRRVARLILTQQGYRVFEAATPAGASELFIEHVDEIDLLVTDVNMPEMNGPTLARRLVALRPQVGLRVLLISGHADSGWLRGAVHEPMKLLSKPFRSSELLRAVREALAEPSHNVV